MGQLTELSKLAFVGTVTIFHGNKKFTRRNSLTASMNQISSSEHP